MIDLPSWLRRDPGRSLHVVPARDASLPSATGARRLVGVGHSHLQALQEAYQLTQQHDPAQAPPMRLIQMLAPGLLPTLMPDRSLNPALLTAIKVAMNDTDGSDPFLFDCISGNEYHLIGLVNHPRRFDFVLPGRPDLPLKDGVEIIPSDLMRRSLRAQMGEALEMLDRLAGSVPCRIWHVQSPPPLADNDYIRLNPTHFAEQIAEHGVSPPSLRMKLWLLQSEIYREHCEALGIGFLPVPEAAVDAEGFLDQRGWLPDPAHAGPWYGKLVIHQLIAQASAG